jgi:hypothetical protein
MHYVSLLIDLLLVLVAAWMVLASIFFIYAYFAGFKNPVSESVVGRMVVISFFVITTSIWMPIIASALALSLIGYLWSRIRANRRLARTKRGPVDPATLQRWSHTGADGRAGACRAWPPSCTIIDLAMSGSAHCAVGRLECRAIFATSDKKRLSGLLIPQSIHCRGGERHV